MRTVFSFSILFFLALFPSKAQSTFPLWTPDGTIKALAATGNTLYVGGSFTAFVPKVHPLAGSRGVVFTTPSGNADTLFPKFSGSSGLAAVVPDGQGGWYVGGGVENVGQNKRNLAARVSSQGKVFDWQVPQGTEKVQLIAATDSSVIIAGNISVQGKPYHLFAVDAETGQTIRWKYLMEGKIHSIVARNNILYVAGEFTTIAGQFRKGLAALDARTGRLLPWNPFDESYSLRDFYCTSLALGDSTLYVCGMSSFLQQSQRFSFLGEIFLATGTFTSWQPTLGNNVVSSIAVVNNTIAASGYKRNINFSYSGPLFTLFNRSTGAVADSSIVPNGEIYTMAVQDSILYLGGSFSAINKIKRFGLASLHLASGKLTDWAPYTNGGARCLSFVNKRLFVGGGFSLCGVPYFQRESLAALDTKTGEILPWNPTEGDQASISVDAFQLSLTRLYVGGKFSAMSGRSRESLAAFDLASGKIVESFASPFRNGTQIFSFALDSNRLFVGGVGFIYQLDAATGALIYVRDTSIFSQNPRYLWAIEFGFLYVRALAVKDRILYVGGAFFGIRTPKYPQNSGESRYSLAAIQIDSLTVTNWNAYISGTSSGLPPDSFSEESIGGFVRKISFQSNNILVAGSFKVPLLSSTFPFESRYRGVAAFDITTAKLQTALPFIDTIVTTGRNGQYFQDTLYARGNTFAIDNTVLYSSNYDRPIAFDMQDGTKKIWQADTTMGYVSEINTLLVHNNVVYAGGSNGLAAFKAYTRPLATSVARAQESLSNVPLLSVHPNPTNGVAIASYLLPTPCRVRLELFDILGRSVRVCVQEAQTAGEHTALIQTSDLPAGVYFLVLESASGKSMQRLVVGR